MGDLADRVLEQLTDLVVLIRDSWNKMVVSNDCPVTRATFLNIRAEAYKVLLRSGSKLSGFFHDPKSCLT